LTLRTLEHLSRVHPDWAMRLLVGSDVLTETAKWHAFERISELAPPYVVARPGYEQPNAQAALLPDVSSTRVRQALASRGTPESDALLSVSLPHSVLAYADEHGLYR
jgi:nicotinic acid mononucleotide adenylyltransferase